MALSDCAKCWETPCVCGHEYKNWSNERLKEFIETLQNIIDSRKIKPMDSALKNFVNMTLEEQEQCQKDLIEILWGNPKK